MMQDPKGLPAPIGVVYSTTMARPDAALALAALYVSTTRHDARVDGICVSDAGLDTAIFCDIVGRFYLMQLRAPGSNSALPIGLPSATPLPPDPPFVGAVVKRTRADGQPQYARSIERITDTALPEALLRNAVTFSAEAVVILSAPATWLARSVALAGTVAQYKQRVKRVVIVEAGGAGRDPAALAALVRALPVPVVFCGREIGDALMLPLAAIETGFTWSPASPVADAWHAAGARDVAAHDLAALHYALQPDSGFFGLSGPGTLTAGADGAVAFKGDASGTVRRLTLNPATRAACVAALVALATSKPTPPQTGKTGG